MSTLILGIGMVLCFEGLVFALAPNYLEKVVKALAELSPGNRQMAGLGALTVGVLLVWASQLIG